MNKLKNVVRAISPFGRQQAGSQHGAGNSLYEESLWQSKVETIDIKHFMQLFYSRYNPEKIHTVDFILDQFVGREDEMLLMLSDKYQISRSDMLSVMESTRRKAAVDSSEQPQHPPAPPVPEQVQHHPTPKPVPRSAVNAQNGARSTQVQASTGLASSRTSAEGGGGRNQSTPMSHREVNQSLKGVIFEVRSAARPPPPPASSSSALAAKPSSNSSSSNRSNLHRNKEIPMSAAAQNQARMQAILDTGSEDGSKAVSQRAHEAVSSSGGESSEESETDEEEILRDPNFKYNYPIEVKAAEFAGKVSSRRKIGNPGIADINAHPYLNHGHGNSSTQGTDKSRSGKELSLRDLNDTASLSGRNVLNDSKAEDTELAIDLEKAREALAASNNQKNEMLRLLEMMAANPRDMNGAISEFIKQHEDSSSKVCEQRSMLATGPFKLGHHSRFDFVEKHHSPDSLNRSSRDIDAFTMTSSSNRVLNLSDLPGHHASLEQDMASLTSERTDKSGHFLGNVNRSGSSPHMRHTKASIKREVDTAKDAKQSGRFVPYHEPQSPSLQITRARSPAPGVSRSNWTGATPTEEELSKLAKRSLSSSVIVRGKAGSGLGYDSPSAWGEKPRSSRAPSPSGYDVHKHNSRAASPTPSIRSVRSVDSFGSNGSLNARNVANRYSSPSPSVRSNISTRSGSQVSSRVPGKAHSGPRQRTDSPGPSGGGRLYFKESNVTNSIKVTGNTNNASFDERDKERSALLEEQYKLAKKYLDHGLEQAKVSQKMAELTLKANTRRVSGHAADAVASVEHEKGVDDWLECFDPRTKRK